MTSSENPRKAQRMLDELEDIRLSAKWMSRFGILKAKAGERIPAEAANKRLLNDAIRSAIASAPNVVRMEGKAWLDVAADRGVAIRWWGESDSVAAFESWLGKRWNFFVRAILPQPPVLRIGQSGTEVPAVLRPSDVPSQLAALTEFASALPSISPRIKVHQVAVTLAVSESDQKRSSREFTFIDVNMQPTAFAEEVINAITGTSIPRLLIEGNKVTIDGETHYPSAEWIEILRLLIEAKGNPMTRATMKERSELLRAESRPDRVIKKMSKDLGIPVKSSKSGYRLPSEYLS